MQIWSVDLGSVADPGFPRGGGPNLHTILPKFPKNCMKWKAFGRGRGVLVLRAPLDPQMGIKGRGR